MKRLKVVLLGTATDDLAAIYRHIALTHGSPETAIRFIRRLKQRCRRIGDLPYAGRPRDDLEPGLRTVAFRRSVVIAYKVEENGVRIANIFYGGRDYEALYREESEDSGAPD